MPLVMKVFEPLTSQSEPSRRAVVRSPCRSEPAPGSLIAIAVIISPLTKAGSQRAFCSSVVRFSRYGATTSLCSVKPTPLAPARVSSSPITQLYRKSFVPPPPYCSGTSVPSRPCLPASSQTARSTSPACSHAGWNGTTCVATKARTMSRKASCSGSYRVRRMAGC